MLFAVFVDDTGTVLTQSSDPTTLNSSNAFFDASIGMNGQACVTCHQPSIGITISTDFINKAFTKSGGTDPLFRPNDTANNPFGTITTDNPDNYSLIKTLGVVRIGKTLPTGANAPDFMIVAANAVTNEIFAAPETFPLTGDPQHLGMPTLSVFRRPLVNTNVNFDSSVLWDGRADISNMRAQVNGAIQTLLLGNGGDNEINDEIAAFMTGVYTDQKSSNVAGQLDAAGATGGVLNLLALSQSASRPCVFDEGDPGDATPDLTPFVAAVATPTSCTPVKPGAQPGGVFTLFDAWASLPNNPGNAGRLSVARGQAVFNTARGLDDEDNVIGCVFCHTVPNLGNNASAGADGFKRIGTESPSIMQTVLATAKADGNAAEIQMVQEMIDRNNQLPMYCLRPKSDMMGGACGTHPTDVVTTDPGRALVTGHIADVGMFKPPILRNLAVRSPYFHAGAAPSIDHLINFYNLRFGFGLNADEQTDLANFIDTGL
jgi:cytochrome c peroxidase